MLQVFKTSTDLFLLDNVQIPQHRGKVYYVHAGLGSDVRNGFSWSRSFKTMAKAFSKVQSGETIVFAGKIQEQLVTPRHVFDVTVIGNGNRPRHADASPVGGNLAANTWTFPASPVAATPLVKVIQQGWRFKNILWAGPTGASIANASIELARTNEGPLEEDASHLEIIGCRFASGHVHIRDTGGCYGVKIQGNRFVSHALWALIGNGNIGVGQSNWEIAGNDFDSNAVATANHVKIAGFACQIHDNSFDDGGAPATTVVLNTNNGGGANNRVYNNHFQTTTGNFNDPDIVGTSTDFWNPNYSFDTLETGTPA